MQFEQIKYPVFKAVAEGAMLKSEVGDGRLIPVIMIDIRDKSEVGELIKLHRTIPTGDTIMQWGRPFSIFKKTSSIVLHVQFVQPVKLKFLIEFDLSDFAVPVDGIIQSRAFYLQTGKKGNRIIEKRENILVEVPDLAFDKQWDKIFFEHMKSEVKEKYKKVKKSEVNSMAKNRVIESRKLWEIRNSWQS